MNEGGLQFRSKNLAERYIIDPHKPRRPVVGVNPIPTTKTPVENIAQTLQKIESRGEVEEKIAHWFEAPLRSTPETYVSVAEEKRGILKRIRKPQISFKTVGAVAAGIVLAFGFISLMTSLRATRPPVEKVAAGSLKKTPLQIDSVSAVLGASTSQTSSTTEQRDTKGVGLVSEDKPSDVQVENYVVSSSHVRYITIPSIGVGKTRITRSAVANDGSIELPKNIWDGGWYESSALPLDKQGAVLILGHIKGETSPGLFYDLYRIKLDDVITLTLGDGTIVKYKVVAKEDVLSDNIDASGVLRSRDPQAAGLTLLTAAGERNPTTGEYEKRQAVFAIRSN